MNADLLNPQSSGAFPSTSPGAAGVLRHRHNRAIYVSAPGISRPSTANGYEYPLFSHGTVAGPTLQLPLFSGRFSASQGEATILEIRRFCGLTWEELANVMGVTPRTLHHWANGKPATAGKEQRLQRLLGALRLIDRGEARRNREVIMQAGEDGSLPYDLLRQGEFDEFIRRVGRGGGVRSSGGPSRLDSEEQQRRRPPAPADLLEALQDQPPSDHLYGYGAK